MVQIDQVSFGYSRRKKLFDGLNLTMEPGHIYGLLGKNGAGKSSLLRLIAGLLFPDDGAVKVGAFEPRHRKPGFLQDIFFIPEEIYLPDTTVDRFIAVLSPFYPNFSQTNFRHYLKEFDVYYDSRLNALSFGQKKKVLIGFGLAANTRILVLDEPTNGLDIPSKSQFRKLIASIMDTNRLVLVSTHQVRDLENLIDTVIIMDQSNILLNQELSLINERLRFTTVTQQQGDPRILYAEPALQGYAVVMENTEKEESRVDLEKLFNTVLKDPDRVRQIFENNKRKEQTKI